MLINPSIIEILRKCSIEDNALKLPGMLDRKSYLAVNAVLERLGGAWNKRAKAHLFERSPLEVIADAIETGLAPGAAPDADKLLGFFETGPVLAGNVVRRAGVRVGDKVLEPSGGKGALVRAALEAGAAEVTTVEIDAGRADILRSITGPVVVGHGDFLEVAPKPVFDRVVANPPFAKGMDARHILHAFKFLRPGGTLVAIAGAGVLFRTTGPYKELAALIESCGSAEMLPENSFKAAGTSVNTALVALRAPL